MRAFIVRPFGTQKDEEGRAIDFERVERELIDPALARLQIEGRTTQRISRQGNIREDMFRLLVTSDIVIADVSIHNANVFYELGIRHALQQRHTFMIRADASKDRYPFDLQTDRYLLYEAADPGSRLNDLVSALSSTLSSEPSTKDSPVFQLLPNLRPHSRAALTLVPRAFEEDVERALDGYEYGDLRLLADEAQGFEWELEGLRLVGNAQLKLQAFGGAKETFEALRKALPTDVHANLRLGTIYHKLADESPADRREDLLTRAGQALKRATDHASSPRDHVEALALLGSLEKTRWRDQLRDAAPDARGATALASPHLDASLNAYLGGFALAIDEYYPGSNALAMLKLQILLSRAFPEEWQAQFDDSSKAQDALAQRDACAARIAAALDLRLGMDPLLKPKQDATDQFGAVARADLLFLTSDKPRRVEREYRKAVAATDDPYTLAAARRNIELFEAFGFLADNVRAALGVIDGAFSASGRPSPDRPSRVVLFTGHMIDTPGRPKEAPRFPSTPEAERAAKALIESALQAELAQEGGISLGIAGGACGGDILFHEICASLGIPTRLFLALPQDSFQVTSVRHGGPGWVERYRKLCERVAPRVLQEEQALPTWLADKADYSIWARNNRWMLFNALAQRAKHLSLIALYNAEREPGGPGGTGHLIRLAERWGFKTIELDARPLVEK